ncbi:hypothetical protein BV25DRAFT_1991918 [Artomyces pyxidatus]|uniref:Uncharacterized protein n=1 Tax=Artomyces pyxidatus TaxID=48021 RepID=A0ACB8SZN4_9AGAM|nr:hypothetical protein BV25DRAFT_1991918 [Artomyces pyxidatus]
MVLNLPKLPEDVLLEILGNLDFKDLISCKVACKTLNKAIDDSVALQYSIELAACGMVDGLCPHPEGLDSTIGERLRQLRLYDMAWRQLRWAKQETLTHLVGFYVSTTLSRNLCRSDDVLVFLAGGSKALLQRTPSILRGVQETHLEVSFQDSQYCEALVDYSQNLLIWTDRSIRCHHLRTLSTGETHPLACNRGVLNTGRAVGITGICGDYLLEDAVYGSNVRVWNWKTGNSVYEIVRSHPYATDSPWLFLDPRFTISKSNRYQEPSDQESVGLRIIRFREEESGPEDLIRPAGQSYIFLLPEFLQHRETEFSCNVSPWRSASPWASGYFHTDPAHRVFSVDVYYRVDTVQSLTFHIPAHTFLSCIASLPATVESTVRVPWNQWGPLGSRVIPRPTRQLKGALVQGARAAIIMLPSLDIAPTVTVFDYHPQRVARALARQRNGDNDTTIVRGGTIAENGMDVVETKLSCIVQEVPVPGKLMEMMTSEAMFRVDTMLCEDGIVIIEEDEMNMVAGAWAYTI